MRPYLPADGPATRHLVTMTTADLDAVLSIERTAYTVPWTRGNFIDSLASGYLAQCLFDDDGSLLGYFLAMTGAGEMHLLNLTVSPAHQGRGHGSHLLAHLITRCREAGMMQLWLEVRASNARARELYRRHGMVEVSRRKAYYPAPAAGPASAREDAIVMSLLLNETR